MPDQNQPDPNQNNQNPTLGSPPSDLTSSTPPPSVPDFQSTDSSVTTPPMMSGSPQDVTPPVTTEEVKPVEDQGSAAPSDLPPVTSSGPKKRFGGKKIIATILGFLVLAGGIAGGVILTQQQQDIREKATTCVTNTDCTSGQTCQSGQCKSSLGGTVSDDKGCQSNNDCGAGNECRAGKCVAKIGNVGGTAGTLPPTPSSGLGGSTAAPTNASGVGGGAGSVTTGSGLSGSLGKDTGKFEDYAGGQGPISCGSSGYSNCQSTTVSEPCPGGGYLIERICTSGCPSGGSGQCWCTVDRSNCVSSTNPPGGSSPTAQCQDIKAYSETWTALTTTELSKLEPTEKVNFCVKGTLTGGTFDKAKFTINGIVQSETSTTRPGSTNEFCQLYTIPAATNSFSITAQIHHVTLGYK